MLTALDETAMVNYVVAYDRFRRAQEVIQVKFIFGNMGILCVFSEMLRNNKDAYSSTLDHGVRRGKCDASGSFSQVPYIVIPCRGRRTLGRVARAGLRRTCHIVGAVVGVLFLLPSPSRGDLVEHGPKDAAPSGLLAGVARAGMTPPVGIAQMN